MLCRRCRWPPLWQILCCQCALASHLADAMLPRSLWSSRADALPPLLLFVHLVFFRWMLCHHGYVTSVGNLWIDISSSKRLRLVGFSGCGFFPHRRSFFSFFYLFWFAPDVLPQAWQLVICVARVLS